MKQRLVKIFSLTLLFFSTGCFSPHFQTVNGHLFLGDKPFSGERVSYNGSTKKVINYQNGLKHGKARFFFPSGLLKKDMLYEKGKPIGIHREFYDNGNKKKLVELKNGEHHGDYIEWYKSGQMYAYAKFIEGKEIGFKKWRPNGRIYANVIRKDGRNIGLSGGKLCLTTEEKPL